MSDIGRLRWSSHGRKGKHGLLWGRYKSQTDMEEIEQSDQTGKGGEGDWKNHGAAGVGGLNEKSQRGRSAWFWTDSDGF